MEFNEHLKAIRKEHKATQKQIAAAIGASERNYQDWEYGRNKPNFDAIIALADYFDVSLDYLVGRSDDPQEVAMNDFSNLNSARSVAEATDNYPNSPEGKVITALEETAKNTRELQELRRITDALQQQVELAKSETEGAKNLHTVHLFSLLFLQ